MLVFFSAYEASVQRLVDKDRADHQPIRMAACGAAAAVVHDLVLTPHDVVKQRLQLGRYSGALDCVVSMWRHEGLRAFYRALPTTMIMNIPYTGMLVAGKESLKQLLRLSGHVDPDDALMHPPLYFLCAGISGAFAAAATSPLDVVKTRLQVMQQPASSGLLSVLGDIVREERFRGLFRGVGPRVMIAAPSAAISWGTYETIRGTLHQRWCSCSRDGYCRDRGGPRGQQNRASAEREVCEGSELVGPGVGLKAQLVQ